MMGATTLGSPDANKGLNGTKKTITDFFGKSPQNSPTIESKPKDLLGYFSKPSCGKNNNSALQRPLVEEFSQLTSSPKTHKKGMPVSNPANSVDSKNKKRKHNGKEFLIISNNSLAEDDNAKSKRRKSNKGIDLFQKDSSPQIKEKNPFSRVLITENENRSGENNKEKAVSDAKEANAKKAQGKSVRRSLAKPKRSDGKMNVYEWTKSPDFSASDKNSGDDLSSGLWENVNKNTDTPKALELSYEEYLLSQETETEPENLEAETEQTEDQLKLDDIISVSSCQKATKPISIATFFSQIQKPPKEETSDSQRVTVWVDIHPEPRQKPSSPEKKNAGTTSGEIVLKTISLHAKSKLKELDSIVILSTEHPSDIKEVQPSDGTKQKSFKKVSSSADRGPKKSAGKNKDSSSAPDVKDGKSSQCLLNFGGHKPLMSKLQDETAAIQNMNFFQSTLTFPKEKSKCQSDVLVKKPEDNPGAIPTVKETVDTKTSLKRKRGRPRKNPIVASKENIALVNQEEQSVRKLKGQNSMKESQTAEKSDRNIVDANVETPLSKKKQKKHLDKISSGEQENAEGSPTEVLISDNSEKESLSSECSLENSKNTPGADESAAATMGTRRSARLRHCKTLSPPSYAEEVHSLPVTSKTHKGKHKSDSGISEKSKESSTGKESNTKQADTEKLAPIFVKKEKEKEKEKEISVIDTEMIKLRRAFLMSGLTDEAKRQQQTNTVMSVVATDYPPIPFENHIQQKPSREEDGNQQGSSLDVWNLPEVLLPGLAVSDESLEVCSLETPEWSCPSSLLRICEDKEIQPLSDKTFSAHSPLSETDVSAAIKILSAANPSYPVQRFYEMAKTKGKNSLKTEGESTKPKRKSAEKPKASESAPALEERKGRGATRRSLGRRKTPQNVSNQHIPEESTQKEKGDKMDCPPEDKGCDILWTEKYQPQHSVEVISNCGNLKKLKSWLLEWKQQTDKEIRKLKKLLQKQRKNKKSKGEDSSSTSSWMDDDSNFEMSTSESEDDSLCNTMLLTGPHGVGKTSAIYALATELGYQIFEMNASSARSGKKILTQLQEATQSHQVSKDKSKLTTAGTVGPSSNLTNQMKEASKNSQKKTAPASFANFFNSSKSSKTDFAGDSQKVKPETTSGKKKQAALTWPKGENKTCKTSTLKLATEPCKPDLTDSSLNSAFDTTLDKMRKRVNVSSTSLILFDEVDVVLEEDKGFWAAIQNFMQSTKRPIILTASSTDTAEQFGSCCEHLSFRLPSTKVITSHLQTLCLAENVVTESSEISSLVNYFNGDMRLCLLNLQFWIYSGGDLTKKDMPSGSNPHPSDEVTISSVSGTEPSDSPKDTLSTKNETRLTHQHCLESCLGLNPNNLKKFFNDDLIKPLSDAISWEDLTPVCHHGYQRHFSLLHQLFTSKLPLPRKSFPPLPNRVRLLQKPNKARKLEASSGSSRIGDFALDSSLYDSETSLDEPVFLSIPKVKEDKMDMNSQPISCSQESEASYSASQSVSLQAESLPAEEVTYPVPTSELSPHDICQQRNCENEILSNMAKFYECCSYNDVFLKSCGHVAHGDHLSQYSATSRSTVTAGLWDELPMEDTSTRSLHLCLDSTFDVAANLELRTYVNCLQDISQAAKKVVDGHEHCISIAPQQQCFGLVNLQSRDQSRSLAQQKAVENVLSNIPLSYGFQQNSLHLDYLPMLREVCRAEKTRQLAKVKRRFFHYFDNIGFPLRESTLNVLANGFT